MNYFRVRAACIAGVQALPVLVETVQSRRLPYVQIIGASSSAAGELRERVLAALDSSRLRLPARRITVQFQPGLHGLPLASLDLPVALALLGGAGLLPQEALREVLVSGGLGLDGSLRSGGNPAALRRLWRQSGLASVILPWEESDFLEENELEKGGGFRNLSDLAAFLRGQRPSGRRCGMLKESEPPPPDLLWSRIPGQEVAKRALEIAAAGQHHLLLQGPPSAGADLLAHALSQLLPSLGAADAEEVRSIYALAGMDQPLSRPFYALGSSSGLPSLLPDRRLLRVEEALLAHRGVLFVDRMDEREEQLFPLLRQPMSQGWVSARLGQSRAVLPFEPLVLGGLPGCGCGARGESGISCVCRPTEARRLERRRDRLLSEPFDLYLEILAEKAEPLPSEPLSLRAQRAQEARERMLARQGKLNGRLREEEAMAVKPWKEGAAELWRVLAARKSGFRRRAEALARVALTVSDLRGGERVEERDLYEAKHYYPASPS